MRACLTAMRARLRAGGGSGSVSGKRANQGWQEFGIALSSCVPHRRYTCVMRPLRYSINVTLDGCCDHRVMVPDEDLHRHAVENLDQADALLFGRVTYEMMEAAWRSSVRTGARPDWMEPFARTIDAAKKHVGSRTVDRARWNAEIVRGDLGPAV